MGLFGLLKYQYHELCQLHEVHINLGIGIYLSLLESDKYKFC